MNNNNEALKAAFEKINKEFGKGSIQTFSSIPDSEVKAISTGSLGLDIALGIGGLPVGRIVEMIGQESSGKTTLALHCIAEAQKKGGKCAFIDAEHALDGYYAKNLGVNLEDLIIAQPDYGEQALSIAETLVSSGAINMVVIDSVAALTPKKEIEGDMGDSSIGLQARMMSQALRKLVATVNRNNCILIFINQWREKIGVMFGDSRVPTGGNALKFYASVRLEITRSVTKENSVINKETELVMGNLTKVKVLKNKVAPPFRTCEFDIMYGKGIAKESELIDLALSNKVMEKSGAWFLYKETKIQGRDKFEEFLIENPNVAEEIKVKLTSK